tara:strand:- start:8062 stop:8712 length:651 start_codon:yes stop_codon:yes gene_type:complete
METKNYYTKSNWKAKATQFAGIIAISFAVLISCQKKNDSGTVYATPAPIGQAGIVGGCAGCTFAQAQLGTPVSNGSSIAVQWNLVGEQTAVQQLLAYGYSAKLYSGQVVLTGTLTARTALSFGGGYGYGYGCQMPAGQYQITSNQVGQMSQGSFGNMQLIASGNGVQIAFTLSNAVVADPSGSGTIQYIFGQLTPTAAVINGQQMSCSDVGFYLSY